MTMIHSLILASFGCIGKAKQIQILYHQALKLDGPAKEINDVSSCV